MRIISKYRDYYDSALGYMQDPNLIYHRTCEEHRLAKWSQGEGIINRLDVRYQYHLRSAELAIIGFCGKLYPRWSNPDFDLSVVGLTAPKSNSLIISNLEAATLCSEYVRKHSAYLSRQVFKDRFSPDVLAIDLQKRLERASIIDDLETFLSLKAPCFVAIRDVQLGWTEPTGYRIWTNPRLALLDMQKLFDPFTAFQEISMFLGNQLAQTDEAQRTTGDDRIIAQSKGFDDQSFRTASPGERKERRKLNRIRKAQGP